MHTHDGNMGVYGSNYTRGLVWLQPHLTIPWLCHCMYFFLCSFVPHTCTQTSQSEFMNIYGAYLKEFKIAVKVLAKCEQNSPQFCEQLSMCQHSFFCEGLSLVSYLLTPVQRLPRYELLLKVVHLMITWPVHMPVTYIGYQSAKCHKVE